MKRPRAKLKGKGPKKSGERAKLPHKTTLARLLMIIDDAADEKEIGRIVNDLSPGTRAMLYSALLYIEPAPGSAEQPNRRYAMHILREFLL